MNTLQETRVKLLAVDCLRALKERKTFRLLSKETGLPAGVLNRYINGYVLPKMDRAQDIIDSFLDSHLQKIINESARRPGTKYIVTADILTQPFLLDLIAYRVSRKLDKKVTKVFTSAVDGIPIALAVARQLGARAIFAKKTQELSFSEHYTSKSRENKPLTSPFYLPRNLLKRGERVLIVDDVIRGGATFDALLSITKQARADIVGVFALFITEQAYREIKQDFSVDYLSLIPN